MGSCLECEGDSPRPPQSAGSPLQPGSTPAEMGNRAGRDWPCVTSLTLCDAGFHVSTWAGHVHSDSWWTAPPPLGGGGEVLLDEVSPGQASCPQPGIGLGPVQSRRGRQSPLSGTGHALSALLRLFQRRDAGGPAPCAGAFLCVGALAIGSVSPGKPHPALARAPLGVTRKTWLDVHPPTLLPDRKQGFSPRGEERGPSPSTSALRDRPPPSSLCSRVSLATL